MDRSEPRLTNLSAFFPCFNEASNVEHLVEAFHPVLADCAETFEMIVVDDGSRDGTADVANGLRERFSELRVVSHERNKGYGGALITGFKSARYDHVFFSDGDVQFEPDDLRRLVPFVSEYDLVTGYRFDRKDHLVRKLNTWGWTTLIRFVLGVSVRDPDCAFKLFRRSILDAIGLDEMESEGAFISAEILYKLTRAGGRIKEIPVRHRPRVAGSPTGANPRVILKAFADLIRFRRRMRIADRRENS